MADRLTQLQDCLDDIMTQMYASLNYIQLRHPYAEIEGQPSQAPASAAKATTTNGATSNPDPSTAQPTDAPSTPLPETSSAFEHTLRELAQDLILKEQQIEFLINSLPGLGSSAADQEQRMRALEEELRVVEAERAVKEVERETLVDELAGLIGGIRNIT